MNIILLNKILTTLVLLGNIAIVCGIILLVAKKLGTKIGGFEKIFQWFGKNATVVTLLIAFFGIVASLVYSDIVGYAACNLCWWQRIFLYPQLVLAVIALIKKQDIADYCISLSSFGLVVGIYNHFLQMGGNPLIPCSADGPSCAQRYIFEYGYITLPMMSVTAFAGIIFVMCLSKRAK